MEEEKEIKEHIMEIFWDEFPTDEIVEMRLHNIKETTKKNHSNKHYIKIATTINKDSEGLFMRKGQTYIQHYNYKTIGRKIIRLAEYNNVNTMDIKIIRLSNNKAIIKEYTKIN